MFVGWYLNKNEDDWDKVFLFSTNAINQDLILYAKWADLKVDSDKDGLPDDIEKKYKTDIKNPDTDSDGLSDYMETMILNYNPLSSDTDNNGTADGDEDPDQDKISNIEEVRLETDPTIRDTDGDGLLDYDEINKYKTDPKLEDTDSDGANDGWEIEHHFDPLVFNKSFDVEISSKQSADDKITASVRIDTNGKQAQSINVEAVNNNSEAFVSDSIPGYLGSAYEFTADGDIPGATLSFSYDLSLAKDGNNFVPRIYYLNEENNTLEELEDQTVEGTKVSAYVSHFSKYILLNKVEFDKVWEYEIQEPIFDNDTMDIMFVIDYSASMRENDPNQIFKDVTQKFVAKLRDGKDRAGAVKFVKAASSVCNLTTDKAEISDAVKSICYDDVSGDNASEISGTNGSAGLKMALDGLNASNSKHKYIVFMTDGDDNTYSWDVDPEKGIVLYDYKDLIAEANRQSITIYTVGLGKVNTGNLTNIAEKTGGKYYHATAAENLEEAFENVGSKTVDLTKDSNNDGIPDYYNELIKQGKLVLSNGSTQFRGIDFNLDKNGKPSNDYDGDGIKNGAELKVVKRGKYVYLEMRSDPTKADSDGDGFVDSADDNPLKWNVSDRDLAIFAALAYETPSTYNNRTINDNYYFLDYCSATEVYEHWNIVDCSGETFADIGTHFYATTYKNNNNVIIAYRGTDEELGEWINNIVGVGLFNYHPEERLAKLYADRIVQKYPRCHIYITGHSLGGYLSQFGAYEIAEKHPHADLKKVAYFNGIGLNYNKLLFWTNKDEINTLKSYYNNSQQNPNLISYNIFGDVVSALGSHSGTTKGFIATSSAIAQHRGSKHGNGTIVDFLSKGAARLLKVLSSEDITYWYNRYGCLSINEYFWITHETRSFFYYLKAGWR